MWNRRARVPEKARKRKSPFVDAQDVPPCTVCSGNAKRGADNSSDHHMHRVPAHRGWTRREAFPVLAVCSETFLALPAVGLKYRSNPVLTVTVLVGAGYRRGTEFRCLFKSDFSNGDQLE